MKSDPSFVREHREVPWRDIRGMRNRMAHGYFETNYEIVWETVSVEIPPLIAALSDLLAKRASEQDGEARRD